MTSPSDLDHASSRSPGDNRTVALQPMVRYMREDPAGFLQHAVCVDRDLDLMLSVSWGRSVRLYAGVDGAEELLDPNSELLNLGPSNAGTTYCLRRSSYASWIWPTLIGIVEIGTFCTHVMRCRVALQHPVLEFDTSKNGGRFGVDYMPLKKYSFRRSWRAAIKSVYGRSSKGWLKFTSPSQPEKAKTQNIGADVSIVE